MDYYPVSQEGLTYHCRLTRSRRHNLATQHINRNYLKLTEFSLPHILHVGVTTVCNLRCPACPGGNMALGRPREHLDIDLYYRALNEMKGSLLFMLFWDWGEPFLHPKLAEMIGYASKLGIHTVVSTNGTAANSTEQIERLVDARPSVVIVCVDGADQNTYETYRKGGKLSDVMNTLRRLAKAKDKLGVQYPVVEFRSLATRYTESQMPSLLQLAEDHEADLFTVKSLRPYDYRGRDIDGEMAPLSADLARYHYNRGTNYTPQERIGFVNKGPLRCGKPFYAPTLNSNGQLAFCSYISDGDGIFGETSGEVKRLWRGKMSRLKRVNYHMTGGVTSCSTCYFRSDHSPTIIHQVPIRPVPSDITIERPQTKEQFLQQVSVRAFKSNLRGGKT